jgi:hypothetical protein
MPGDGTIAAPDVVMAPGFSPPVPPERCWPWFVQLGKGRSGWYFPRWVERFIPRRRRAVRSGKDAYFDVAGLAAGLRQRLG